MNCNAWKVEALPKRQRHLLPKFHIQCFNPRSYEQRKGMRYWLKSKVSYSMKLILFSDAFNVRLWIGNYGVKSGFFLLNCQPIGFGGFGLLCCFLSFPSLSHELVEAI
jgi:hypothetical protein